MKNYMYVHFCTSMYGHVLWQNIWNKTPLGATKLENVAESGKISYLPYDSVISQNQKVLKLPHKLKYQNGYYLLKITLCNYPIIIIGQIRNNSTLN